MKLTSLRLIQIFSLAAVISLIPLFTSAQVDLTKYIDQNTIPLLNRSTALKVNFQWDMDGKSQAMLNDGLSNLDEGNWQLALGSFESFLNANYKLWVGHYYRGEALMHLGRVKEAQVEFSAVTKLNPKLPQGFVKLGETFEYQRAFDEAEKNFQQAVFIDPKFVYGYFRLGNLFLYQREYEEAIKNYKKCNKLDPKFPDAYLAQGIIAFRKERKYPEAIALFTSSVKADSTYGQAYFWRGLTYLQIDKKDNCITDWDRFIRRNPRNPFVTSMRGFLKAELGDFESAFSDFRKVLQAINVNEDKFTGTQTPLDKRIDLQFAANYLIKKGYGLKEEAFSSLKAGFCLLLMGQDAKAIDYFKKADRMATSPAISFLLAIGYEHVGVHQAAFEYYNKALKLDNDIFDAHKKRSIYFSEMGQWNAAYKDINEMLRIQPGALVAFKLRGMMASSQKKYTEAIDDLTKSIQADTTDIEALRNRSICYSLINKPVNASEDLKRLIDLEVRDETLYEKLVNDFLSIKDTVNSVYVLKRYVTKYPNPQGEIELIKIYVEREDYQEANSEILATRNWIKVQQGKLLVFSDGQIGTRSYEKLSSFLLMYEGLMAFKQAKFAEAVKILTRSVEEDHENLESKYLRAKSYVKLKNTKKAMEDLRDLKEKKYKDAAELSESLTKN